MANDQGTYLACINHVEASGTTFATTTEDVGDRVLSNVATTQSDDFWRVDGLEALATEFVAEITLSEDKTIEAISVQFPRDQYPGVSEDALTLSERIVFASPLSTRRWPLSIVATG